MPSEIENKRIKDDLGISHVCGKKGLRPRFSNYNFVVSHMTLQYTTAEETQLVPGGRDVACCFVQEDIPFCQIDLTTPDCTHTFD